MPLGADGHPGAVGTLSRAGQAGLRVKVTAGGSLGDQRSRGDLAQIGRPGQWLEQINHNPGGKSGGQRAVVGSWNILDIKLRDFVEELRSSLWELVGVKGIAPCSRGTLFSHHI